MAPRPAMAMRVEDIGNSGEPPVVAGDRAAL
jgi:hypothetical protein